MARIVIRSPLLDLCTGDGAPVPSAVNLNDEEKAALRADIGESIARQLRLSLPVLMLVEPALAQIAREGLYVSFEDASAETDFDKRARVPVPEKQPQSVCHHCRSPSTRWLLRGVCETHAQGSMPRMAQG